MPPDPPTWFVSFSPFSPLTRFHTWRMQQACRFNPEVQDLIPFCFNLLSNIMLTPSFTLAKSWDLRVFLIAHSHLQQSQNQPFPHEFGRIPRDIQDPNPKAVLCPLPDEVLHLASWWICPVYVCLGGQSDSFGSQEGKWRLVQVQIQSLSTAPMPIQSLVKFLSPQNLCSFLATQSCSTLLNNVSSWGLALKYKKSFKKIPKMSLLTSQKSLCNHLKI